jgi:hypothetical protein
LVAAMLYVAVNKVEPNSRDAAGLKILIIGLAGAAILVLARQVGRRPWRFFGDRKLLRQMSDEPRAESID